MSVFEGVDTNRLTLRRMHFHAVGPPPAKGRDAFFEKLGEVDHKGFEDFFLDRIRDCRLGNDFVFNRASQTLAKLRRLLSGNGTIGGVSEDLAQQFAKEHTLQMSPGVFMLLDIAFGTTVFHAMLKFDDREVVSYKKMSKRTVLERLERTFVEDKNAMQKVAIARMRKSGEVPLLVLERSDRRDGTEYFRRFLDAQRCWDEKDLTLRVEKVVNATKKELSGVVDDQQIRGALGRAREFMRKEDGLDESNLGEFRSHVFGPDQNGVIERVLAQQFRHEQLDGEAFSFDKSVVKAPRQIRLRTYENIIVTFSPDYEDRVKEKPGQIIIETEGVKDRDDASE